MNTFCTIITSDYFPYAVTLYRSLTKINPAETLKVLICDEGDVDAALNIYPGIQLLRIKDLYSHDNADILYTKYAEKDIDALRWSMKPVLLSFLLAKGYGKIFFCDCDIYFTGDSTFLLHLLDENSIILSPHWYTRNPFQQEEEFNSFYKFGAYNAGFIGVSSGANAALKWWANACRWKVEKNFSEGLYDDQKYLDSLPVLFENVHILKHKGCNIAFWNQHECKRTIKNGRLQINDTTAIIFIHFTNNYIKELLEGNDPLVFPYFKEYETLFQETGYKFSQFIGDTTTPGKDPALIRIKKRLLLRTRFKKWLFRISQSI